MRTHGVTMKLVKETKGALRYEGIEGDDPTDPFYIIGTLYLRKNGVRQHMGQGDWPAKITVEVSDAQV